jgi:peptide deformylase
LDENALAAVSGILLSAAQRKDKLAATGLSPVFNEQTPKCEPTDLAKVDVKLIEDIGFFALYNEHLSLAGVAANQLQKDGKRLDMRLCYILMDGKMRPALNPTIVNKSGFTFRNKEGCLTWPDKRIVALRYSEIEVKYVNPEDMKEVTRKASDMEAVIWQHEIDHLDGIKEEFIIQLTAENTPGRNDPCICGKKDANGRPAKFKKCCGR